MTPESATFTCHHLRVDSGKAKGLLGYQETGLDTLLADTIDWLRSEHMLGCGR